MRSFLLTALLVLCILTAAAPAGAAPTGPDWALRVVQTTAQASRPRMLLTAADLPRLAHRSLRDTPLWRSLLRWAEHPQRQAGRYQDGPGLALVWLLLKRHSSQRALPFGSLAVACALKALEQRPAKRLAKAARQVEAVALTLDWAWGAFNLRQRQRVARWLVEAAMARQDQGRGCFDSDSAAAFKMTLLAGLAAQGLHPDADALVRQALEKRFQQEILPCLSKLGRGGGWFEGANLGARAGLDLLISAAVVKSAAGQDILDAVPWFEDRLGQLIFMVLPGQRLTALGPVRMVAPGGDQVLDPVEAADLIQLQMALLAKWRPDDPAAGWARSLLVGSELPGVLNGYLLPYQFIWREPEAPLRPLALAPLAHRAQSVGVGVSRSDWSELATWLMFQSGPHFARAQHLEALSLSLYRRGTALMPPAGAYDGPTTSHALNYAIRSLAKNTVFIYDPDEYSWYDLRQGVKPRGTYANDGGQRAWADFAPDGRPLRHAPWTAASLGQWEEKAHIYQVASLGPLARRPRYAYFRGDATWAYRGSTDKARRVVRHVFHLRGGGPQDARAAEAVLVVDDLVLRRPGLRAGVTLHFPDRPQMTKALDPLGPGRYQGRAGRMRLAVDDSRLEVVCLLPANPAIRLVGGRGLAASWVDGMNYPPIAPAVNPAPWRVEIEANTIQQAACPMVHILFPADAGDPPPPPVDLLRSAGGKVLGAVIHDPRWPRVVAVRLGQPDPGARITYPYPPGPSRHLVAGLAAGISYRIQAGRDQVTLVPDANASLTTSAAGTLSFQVVPGAKPAAQAGTPQTNTPTPAPAGQARP